MSRSKEILQQELLKAKMRIEKIDDDIKSIDKTPSKHISVRMYIKLGELYGEKRTLENNILIYGEVIKTIL